MTITNLGSLLAFLSLGIPELLIILVIGGGLLAIVVAVIFCLVKANTKTPQGAPPLASSREIKLKELESLRSQSLITEEEYRTRRQKVLDEL